MKKGFLMMFVAVILTAAVATNSEARNAMIEAVNGFIKFNKTEHDFGTINQGEKVSYTFTYVNETDEPIILTDVRAGCGCTMPEWSRAPLMKGKKGELKVVFNSAGKINEFYKQVYVTSNRGKDTIVVKGFIKKTASDNIGGDEL
jgi:hypothetical protein